MSGIIWQSDVGGADVYTVELGLDGVRSKAAEGRAGKHWPLRPFFHSLDELASF